MSGDLVPMPGFSCWGGVVGGGYASALCGDQKPVLSHIPSYTIIPKLDSAHGGSLQKFEKRETQTSPVLRRITHVSALALCSAVSSDSDVCAIIQYGPASINSSCPKNSRSIRRTSLSKSTVIFLSKFSKVQTRFKDSAFAGEVKRNDEQRRHLFSIWLSTCLLGWRLA